MLLYSTDPCGLQDSRRAQCGFSLVELMIVVALLGILAGIAAPSFGEMIARQRVSNAANDLYASLMYARSTAITRRENVIHAHVEIDKGGGEKEGYWVVYLEANPPSPLTDISASLRVERIPDSVVFEIGDFDEIAFRSNGRTISEAELVISYKSSSAQYNKIKKCIGMSPSGSPVVKNDEDGDGDCP